MLFQYFKAIRHILQALTKRKTAPSPSLVLSIFWASRGHGCRPFSPRVRAFIHIAQMVHNSLCPSTCIEFCQTHALALSVSGTREALVGWNAPSKHSAKLATLKKTTGRWKNSKGFCKLTLLELHPLFWESNRLNVRGGNFF